MVAASGFAAVGLLLVLLLVFLLSSSQGRFFQMLVLSRTDEPGKNVILLETSDGPVQLQIDSVNGNNVRISIDAPRTVAVIRPDAKVKRDASYRP